MAHFAKIGLNSKVIGVHAVDNKDLENADGIQEEEIGRQYLERIHHWPLWKQTSYNTVANTHKLGGTPLRGNYAGVGYTYDEDEDIFWPPKPHASWVKDMATASWKSPIGDRPEVPAEQIDTHYYVWNESGQSWDLTEKNA
jgi:hypothetical protein|tara:strand:- start:129 stop:551 length:423 start_codon:yes stop_codon:yes gene_type:complete